MRKSVYFIIAFILCSVSCNEDDDKAIVAELKGFVQKGPYIEGTQITIQELNENYLQTGNVFNSLIENNHGFFSFSGILASNKVELFADGFYFNEVKGKVSESKLTLKSLNQVENDTLSNVNILSTLIVERIKYLVQNNNIRYAEAKNQAQLEVLNIFNISNEEVDDFNHLNISELGVANEILLAISVILQASNTTSELTELLSRISNEIREDGNLEDLDLKNTLKKNSMYLVANKVNANLLERYEKLGASIVVPNFEDYLDNNGNGIINKNDEDPFLYNGPTKDLIGAYHFFSGTIDDLSANKNDMVIDNVMFVPDRFNNDGSALKFNGSNSVYVEYNQNTPIDIGFYDNYTLIVWFQAQDLESHYTTLLSNEGSLNIYQNKDRIGMTIRDRNSNTSGSMIPNSLNLNQWYCLAIVNSMKTREIKAYINGDFKSSTTYIYDLLQVQNKLTFGNNFKGIIDDIYIFDRALSSEEIYDIYINNKE